METVPTYPLHLTIDYPERRDKLTVFFRILTVIPIAIVLGLLVGSGRSGPGDDQARVYLGGSGFVIAPVVLMLLFRQKYPRWWFDWNVALTTFAMRVGAYLALLSDEYPSTDEEQGVHLEIPYPNVPVELNRWLPLVKWFLAIPHYIVLVFLLLAAFAATVIAWLAILIVGRYPRDLFDFVVGVHRWALRVDVYAFLLTTDRYPPFRLGE